MGYDGLMDIVKRAAQVISETDDMDDWPDWHRAMPIAQALEAAGLLVSERSDRVARTDQI